MIEATVYLMADNCREFNKDGELVETEITNDNTKLYINVEDDHFNDVYLTIPIADLIFQKDRDFVNEDYCDYEAQRKRMAEHLRALADKIEAGEADGVGTAQVMG